jgi:hypothetical protein
LQSDNKGRGTMHRALSGKNKELFSKEFFVFAYKEFG